MRYLITLYNFCLLLLCVLTAMLISIALDDTGHAPPDLLIVVISSWIILPFTCFFLRKVYRWEKQKFKSVSLFFLALTALVQLYYMKAIIYPTTVLIVSICFFIDLCRKVDGGKSNSS
jgi:hypothetical protein